MRHLAPVPVLVAALASMAFAADAPAPPDVDAIVRRANLAAYYAGADGRAKVRLTIRDDRGRERLRQFVILRQDVEDGGDQRYLVHFERPADVRKTVFLVHKHPGGDDDRWLYLPGLDLVKRIAAGDKRTSFVGSHYLYEDVSGRSLAEDRHELEETTETTWVIRNTPLDPGAVEFDHYLAHVDRTTHLPRLIEYFDENGKRYRTVEALAVEEIGGHPTVTKARVTDDAMGGETIAEFRYVDYDLELPDSVFTERSLREPPRSWLSTR